MTKKIALLAATATSITALSAAASAQTIDYGSLEMLFDEPVTTSATGKPQRASDAPVAMEIISAEEIQRSGATDIPELLRFYAGMSVQRSTMGGVDVGMRGYNGAFNERILVLINGRQTYLDFFGYVEWAALPVTMEEIRQIEVIKGPNTALYGFNAVSGVINIITYNPMYDENFQVTVRGGTHAFKESNLTLTKKLSDKIGIHMSAGLWRGSDFTTHLDNRREDILRDDTQRNFVSGTVMVQATDNIQAGFEFSAVDSEQGELFFDSTFSFTDYVTSSLRGFVTAETGAGVTSLNVYKNKVDVIANQIRPVEGEFRVSDIEATATIFELSQLFKVGTKHAFRLGLGYRDSENSTFPVAIASLDQTVWSGSAMWDWTINDQLSFVLAGRYDSLKMSRTGDFLEGVLQTNADFNRTINEFGFNAGLVYKMSDKDTIRLTAAKGIDLPSSTEFSVMADLGDPVFQLGNPDLKVSDVFNYEIGYERSIESIEGSFKVNTFYYKANNLQNTQQNEVTELSNGHAAFFAENSLDTRAYGVEFALKGRMNDALDWFANYMLVDVKDTSLRAPDGGSGVEDTEAVDFANNAPKSTFNFGLNYKKDKFDASIKGSYTSDRRQLRGIRSHVTDLAGDTIEAVVLNFVPIKGQIQLNAVAGYQLNEKMRLSVEAIGLSKKFYRQTSLARIERRFNVSLNYKF